ncbi:MAG: hypothetical protein GY851_36920 [bacterium]|nr:hypothetical protein [bacterium]
MGDKRAIVFIGILVAIMGGTLLLWRLQGGRMAGDFVDAMRAGRVEALQVELRDKVWSEEELAATRVLKLPSGTGRERALTRSMHAAGEYTISRQMYAYQATVTDSDTGIKHLFGYRRRGPSGWCWVGIHPDSAELHIRRRAAEAERLLQKDATR